jgi:tRNA dimethylallyltransferase
MDKLVFCLMGPTASGKTALACDWVQQFPFEIISVDSAMIYRGMDIGTAKPDAQTLAHAPHHLIDVLDPTGNYSAAQFCDDAVRLCDGIHAKGKIPLLVGGTMMYFRALQQGLSALPEANDSIRAQLLHEMALYGVTALHAQLATVDPESAARIHAHDTQRIQRALEVYRVTGQSLSSWCLNRPAPLPYQFINVMLLPASRTWLHARIALRFSQMLSEGWIDEVKGLVQQWSLTSSHPAMRCVGYRQILEYLNGAYDEDILREKGIAATRQLAKRQLTWLRHWPNGEAFEADDPACARHLTEKVKRILI